MNNIFEKLTHNMTEDIESAIYLALHNKNQEVQIEHFFWALLTNSTSVLNQMFNKMNIDKTAIELDVRSLSEKLQRERQKRLGQSRRPPRERHRGQSIEVRH